MVFIWRGFGLIVPIVAAICAWIVGYWFDDHSVGNKSYSGWVSFYTAIVLLLPGLAMLGGTPEEDGTKKKHDFFFIPVLFWALIFGGLSVFCLFTRDSEPDENTASAVQTGEETQPEKEKLYRTVNFLNSSEDTLVCVIKTDDRSEKITVEPKSWKPMELLVDSYTFVINDMAGANRATFTTGPLGNPSGSKVDYESGWIQMDNGGHKLLLINVMPMMPADFTSSDLKKYDWTTYVIEEFDGRSFMEPKVPKGETYNSRVLEPGDFLPSKLGTDETCYALITVPGDQKLTNEYLIERLTELYFK